MHFFNLFPKNSERFERAKKDKKGTFMGCTKVLTSDPKS